MKKVYIVGMGMSARDVTAAQLEIIQSAQILMGGQRHLDQFKDLSMEKRVITGKVAEAIDYIGKHRADRRIVVLASGDPLFYGIGAQIVQALGCDQVKVFPNITSIAAAFARIGEPWSGVEVISLHGRDRKFDVLAALKRKTVVAVLTDQGQSPGWLARWLMDKAVDRLKMAVFEKLGSSEETFGWYTPDQAAGRTFARPNVVILKPAEEDGEVHTLALGMPDDTYCHESGLITKSEVRAVTLAKLQLRPGLTLWDLGAGSGSVGIEASVLLGSGRIIAVEQKAGRVRQIRQNARRYGVYNHEVIQAKLPDALERLPSADRIFIGGGGRDLASIVQSALRCLEPGGVMVVNTVLVDNLTRTLDVMEAEGMDAEVVQMQVGKSKKMPWSRRLEARNPVWIVSGIR
ncbi:MAG: precorrin-6y C5,15-methyltransferase (decarboxylating) subunit CbiE [Desulfobacteraceae bacterium]